MTRTAVRALLALLAGLLLAGCVKVDGALELEADDTVSGSVVVAVGRAWAVSQGEDPEALVDAMTEELEAAPDAGVTGERYDDGEYTGLTLTLAQVPIERIGAATNGMLTLEHAGGEYVLTGDFSELDPTVEGEDAPESPWLVHLSLTFPDGVTEHDGTLDGDTVTWDLATGDTSMSARGPAPTSFTDRVPVAAVVGIAVVALGAAVAWWFGRRIRLRDAAAGRQTSGFRSRHDAGRGPTSSRLSDLMPGPDDEKG